jgi:hypothetical protein
MYGIAFCHNAVLETYKITHIPYPLRSSWGVYPLLFLLWTSLESLADTKVSPTFSASSQTKVAAA